MPPEKLTVNSVEHLSVNSNSRQSAPDDGTARARVIPSWGGPLSVADYFALESCWITREIAEAAMLRRVDTFDGQQIVGQKGSRDCAGILIPYFWPGDKNAFSYRIRRDNPELVIGQNGKRKPDRKYLAAPSAGNRIFVPAGITLNQLTDANVAVALVEGEKKALALSRLANYEASVPRFIPIAIAGVWNWRGVVGKTGGPNGERLDLKGPIPDLDRIEWKGRTVYIVFDANVATNESVRSARSGVAKELAQRGAAVRFVNIPVECGINGIDDLLAQWGPDKVLELFARSVSGCRVSVVAPPQYQLRPEGMFRVTGKDEQHLSQVQLSNYKAIITRNIRLDDGVETKCEFEITAELMGRPFRFNLSPPEFSRMDWPIAHLGPGAVTFPNQREYTRAAIQLSSLTAEEKYVYTHIGWRYENAQWLFLHAGAAIGRTGAFSGIDMRLPRQVHLYELRTPPNRDALVLAIRSSLALLDLAPAGISFPLSAATYRAVLGQSDFGIHLAGETGVFKSELAALHQQHFGAGMNRLHLPGAWSSTGNALEALAFLAKDTLLVIDDFAPQGSVGDIANYHASADRVFRAAGNQAGRARLDSSAKLRESKSPRALILSTGEEVPRGHSIRARLLILELPKNSINPDALTCCQQNAAAGLYAQSMGAFVQYVAGQRDLVFESLRCMTLSGRSNLPEGIGHVRTPDIVANLQAAFELFLLFAEEVGAIDSRQRGSLTNRCSAALREAAHAQSKHHSVSNPARRFISILSSLLASGRVHLRSRNGDLPCEAPQACGWRNDENAGWSSQGACVGWVDHQGIFLDLTAAFSAVQLAGRDIGEMIGISEQTLKKRLHENGFLASVDKTRETLAIRKNISGASRGVLHLCRQTLISKLADEDDA